MDPYKELGVAPSASDDEVKQAYRKLAKKFHPDHYHDAPENVQKQATEKMKRINAAYEEIQAIRSGKRTASSSSSSSSGGYGGPHYADDFGGFGGFGFGGFGQERVTVDDRGGDALFSDIRQLLNRGLVAQAEDALRRCPERNAEWYYLYGVTCLRRARYDAAREAIAKAVALDGSNTEYRAMLNKLQYVEQTQRSRGDMTFCGSGLCGNPCVSMALCALCSGGRCFFC